MKIVPESKLPINLYRGSRNESGLGTKKFTYFVYGNNARNIVKNAYIKNQFRNEVHLFKLTDRNVKLIDMSDYNTVKEIHAKAPRNVKNAMNLTFQIQEKNKYILRNSDPTDDDIIVKYLCTKGYNGYMTPRMRSHGNNSFHQELVLCNAQSKVNKPSPMGRRIVPGTKEYAALRKAQKLAAF